MHRIQLVAGLSMLLAFAAAAAAPAPAGGVRYHWLGADGVSHFSDALTQQAIDSGYEIVAADGIVVERVARPQTAAERAAAHAAARRGAQQAESARRRRADARQLLAAYASEDSLRETQGVQRQALQDRVEAARASVDGQRHALAQLLDRAADQELQRGKVAADLRGRLAAQWQVVLEQRDALAAEQREFADFEARAAADLEAYRAALHLVADPGPLPAVPQAPVTLP